MKMKNMSFWMLMLLVISLVFSGCGAQTTGKDIQINNEFNITNNTGSIDISPDLTTKSGDTDQEVTAPTTTINDIPFDITATPGNALKSAIEAGVAGDIKDAAEELVPEKTVEPVGEVVEEPVPSDSAGESLGSWSCKPYTRTVVEGEELKWGKSACRIAADFKKHTYSVTFIFDNGCGEFSVPSGVGRYEDLPNGKEDYVYYDYEKGTPAVFTPAGCVATSVEAFRG